MLTKTNLDYEEILWRAGIVHICGIDEVGRGPVAGPVTACAVIFKKGYYHPEVIDSKLLNKEKRLKLSSILCQQAVEWQVGAASVEEIDRINIRQATFLAMRRAINRLRNRPDYALIDGEGIEMAACASQGIIKGDNKSFTIAAASIIAKEIRDKYMVKLGSIYPVYKFEKNMGYGTEEHIRAIKKYGICQYHRRTFLKRII